MVQTARNTTDERVSRATCALLDARRRRVRINTLPSDGIPTNSAEAFSVQLAVLKELGEGIGGYKVSMSSGSPKVGIIQSNRVIESPADLPHTPGLKVETEIALIVGDKADTVAPGTNVPIRGVATGIELIESRFLGRGLHLDAVQREADFLSSGGYVYGPIVMEWQPVNLQEQHIQFFIGHRRLIDEKVQHPTGDPLGQLKWLAGHLKSLGLALEPGQIVTTGSYTGSHLIISGDDVTVRFGETGEAKLTAGPKSGYW